MIHPIYGRDKGLAKDRFMILSFRLEWHLNLFLKSSITNRLAWFLMEER